MIMLEALQTQSQLKRSDTLDQAIETMQNVAFLGTPRYSEQQMRHVSDGAHPHIIEFYRKLVKKMERLGVPVCSHKDGMMRTPAMQNEMFRRGVSKVRGKNGAHPNGCAVDVIHSTRGWDLTPSEWRIIGHIGKELAQSLGIRMVWGGDWKRNKSDPIGWDPAHWELFEWRTAWERLEKNGNGRSLKETLVAETPS